MFTTLKWSSNTTEVLKKDATVIRGNIHQRIATALIQTQTLVAAAASRVVMKRVSGCTRDMHKYETIVSFVLRCGKISSEDLKEI